MPKAIGIDLGGTGIKTAVIDALTGQLHSPRHRIDTPHPATPNAIRDAVANLRQRLDGQLPVGVALPAVVRDGVVQSAANIDRSWVGSA